MTLKLGEVRQFVKVSDGRIGVVMANETCGGVLRGHCDMWFGEFALKFEREDRCEGVPKVERLLVEDDWKAIEAPTGEPA